VKRKYRKTDSEKEITSEATPVASKHSPDLSQHERLLVTVVSLHVCFMPWALGSVLLLPQCLCFVFSLVEIVILFLPSYEASIKQQARASERLLRLPAFWIGALFILYLVCGLLNPAWVYKTDHQSWWIESIHFKAWLPHGVLVPFSSGGPLRSLMLWSSAWLTGCAIAVGFTRSRMSRNLLTALTLNGGVLALLGISEKLLGVNIPASDFGAASGSLLTLSFVYKNHAGAYMLIIISCSLSLALWHFENDSKRGDKSNPSGLYVLLTLIFSGAIMTSYARGATITMLCLILIIFIIFILKWWKSIFENAVITLTIGAILFSVLIIGLYSLNAGEAWDRIANGLDGKDGSLASREIATQAGNLMAHDHFLFGVGGDSFRYVFPEYQKLYPQIWTFGDKGPRMVWEYMHNDLLQYLVEYGIVGVSILVLLIGATLYNWVRYDGYKRTYNVFILLGGVALLFAARWDFPLQCPAIFITAIALAAASWGNLRRRIKPENNKA